MDSFERHAQLACLLLLIGSLLTSAAPQNQYQSQQAQLSTRASSSSYGSAVSTPSKYCPNTQCIAVNNQLYFANGTSRPLTASEQAEIKAAQQAQQQALNQSLQQYQVTYSQWRTEFNANGGPNEQKPSIPVPQLTPSVQMPVSVVELSPGTVLQWQGQTITASKR